MTLILLNSYYSPYFCPIFVFELLGNMIRRLTLPLLLLAIVSSCTTEKTEIRAVAEITPEGNYYIKWETFPPIDGNVKIYSSFSPDNFDTKSLPIKEEQSETGYAIVPALKSDIRTYYKLVFEKNLSIVVSERVISMEHVFNLRDLGGYNNKENKQLKWGKIYRSSSFASATDKDLHVLEQLDLKTVIDLRTSRDVKIYPPRYRAENNFNIPLRGNSDKVFFDQILAEKMTRRDIINYLENGFHFFAENNSDHISDIFDILLEEDNYPVAFYCSLGKDRSAIISAIILSALDVSDNAIIYDYMLSDDLIDYHSQVENASLFSAQIQESLTALFGVHRETITYSLQKIKQEYGTVENYLKEELGLTDEKRQKLKELLLYN